MSDKPRPPNAAGPNGLRGGIKTFTPKTITGPWFDTLGGAAGYKRGFTTHEYETEAQHQQRGATLQVAPEFGAELPDEIQLNRPSSPFKYDTKGIDKSAAWSTNTMLMSQAMVAHSKDREIPTSLKPKLTHTQLDEYRRTWTTESDAMRQLRFGTEARRQGSAVGPKFAVNSVRALPGTPKPYEQYREAMVEMYGLFAFTVVRYHMGKEETIALRDFRAAMRETGVEMKLFEVNQIIAFTTPSSTAMSVAQFMHILKGHVLGFERVAAERIFAAIARDVAQGGEVRTEHILQAIDQQQHPEVAVAVEKYAERTYAERGTWTAQAFVEMQHDVYAASPAEYTAATKCIWNVQQ